ncbi:hypothetical protein KIW84_021073 [Lathyrus oleraceus]|uniref:Aminotransferase-like plant mobile domain-containing protein n=1 Tax=Pisum sativum TaxID=3888 RepID=A0A9D4Y833_PEA|nr:hypothetical protein KIW84_021073 [Pisum sativum]
MASSSKNKALPFAAKLTQPLTIDGKEYVLEPPFAEEKAKIWRSQVLIPFSLSDKPLAFLGSLPENRQPEITKKNSFFATSHLSEPLVSSQKPFSFHYIARYGPPQSFGMLLAALQFGDNLTNSFHTKCGMITPTLLDIAAITGLKPTGEVFDCEAVPPVSLRFDVDNSRKLTYNNFIDHHATSSGPVTTEEHVAFLTLWLSHFVFCSRSMQIAKHFALLATQLHQERDIALGQLILASLYESLSEIACQIKLFDPENSKKINVLLTVPLLPTTVAQCHFF